MLLQNFEKPQDELDTRITVIVNKKEALWLDFKKRGGWRKIDAIYNTLLTKSALERTREI